MTFFLAGVCVLLMLVAAALYALHHIKRLRAVARYTRYTKPLYGAYVLAAIFIWINPLLWGLSLLTSISADTIVRLRQPLIVFGITLLIVIGILYMLDKQAQRRKRPGYLPEAVPDHSPGERDR